MLVLSQKRKECNMLTLHSFLEQETIHIDL